MNNLWKEKTADEIINDIGKVSKKILEQSYIPEKQVRHLPCSPSCYHHISHPCEKCGRILGFLPEEFRKQSENKDKNSTNES